MSVDKDRRNFIAKTIRYGFFAAIGASFPNRESFAMGTKDYPQGMRKIEGTVSINDMPAQLGSIVRAGDIVTTGPASLAIFVAGKDVYMLRDHTRLELGGSSSEKFKENPVNVLRLINGKMMAVFRNSPKRLEMPTGVAGVRGTGLYA
ncbi:MAG: FecR domain-containing protein, partial [Desulfobacteraceae bacterium]|nr:FecR domain-containing protein [Desulfobacteraceae bacterium]